MTNDEFIALHSQVRCLSIAKWTVLATGKKETSFVPLPNGRQPTVQVGDELTVCVFGIGVCCCSLFLAFEEKLIVVPEGLKNIEELASTSESEILEGVDESDFRYTTMKKYFPALLTSNQKQVRAKVMV